MMSEKMVLAEEPLAKVVTPPVIDYEKEGLVQFEGVTYKVWKEREYKMDIVCPKEADKVYPAVVWIHGGGWTDENLTRKYLPSAELAELCKRGYVTASIDYRMCQVARFPAQMEDCKAAVRFLRAHAAEYRIDPERIAVWGESAGGHLAELTAYSSDTEFQDGTNLEVSSRISGVVSWYAPCDLSVKASGWNEEKNRERLSRLYGCEVEKMSKEMIDAVSPITYADRENPPTLLMHGDADRLVNCETSHIMYDALKKGGNEVELIVVPGQGHGFFDGDKYYQKIYQFFDKVLKNK